MLTAHEAPEVDVFDVLAVLVELTRSLLLESTVLLLDEPEFEEPVEGAAAELFEELEPVEPAPGMVSWSPG